MTLSRSLLPYQNISRSARVREFARYGFINRINASSYATPTARRKSHARQTAMSCCSAPPKEKKTAAQTAREEARKEFAMEMDDLEKMQKKSAKAAAAEKAKKAKQSLSDKKALVQGGAGRSSSPRSTTHRCCGACCCRTTPVAVLFAGAFHAGRASVRRARTAHTP